MNMLLCSCDTSRFTEAPTHAAHQGIESSKLLLTLVVLLQCGIWVCQRIGLDMVVGAAVVIVADAAGGNMYVEVGKTKQGLTTWRSTRGSSKNEAANLVIERSLHTTGRMNEMTAVGV